MTVEDRVRSAWPKNAFVYALILLASILLFYSFLSSTDGAREVPIDKVAEWVREGKVTRLATSNDGNIAITVQELSLIHI